jgi:hypothetical protein
LNHLFESHQIHFYIHVPAHEYISLAITRLEVSNHLINKITHNCFREKPPQTLTATKLTTKAMRELTVEYPAGANLFAKYAAYREQRLGAPFAPHRPNRRSNSWALALT